MPTRRHSGSWRAGGTVSPQLVNARPPVGSANRCPCRKSDPDVLVVETTENRPRKNPANGMNYT